MHKESVLLTKEGIKNLYQHAFRNDNAAITQTTNMVIDTHLLGLPECQALLVDKNQGIVFTKLSTSCLVKRFISLQNLNFSISVMIIEKLYPDHSHRHIVPFISGQAMLMPLSGYVRSSATWIMLSNLIDYTVLGKEQIGLQFTKNHGPEYTLIEKESEFEKNYQNCLAIAETEIQMIQQLLKDFPPKFVTKIHGQFRRVCQGVPLPMVSVQKGIEVFTDEIIEDALTINSSLISEALDPIYAEEIKKGVRYKRRRLR